MFKCMAEEFVEMFGTNLMRVLAKGGDAWAMAR